MSQAHIGAIGARALPARPNLEHLKKAAKARLEAMRAVSAQAQLSDAQFQLAREYGFSSWRELKAEVERRAMSGEAIDPAGDWISDGTWKQRIALHIRRDEAGALEASLDSRDIGLFGIVADGLVVENGRLSFTVITPPGENLNQGLYEATWDGRAQAWQGEWTALGQKRPLNFVRGVYPPAPRIAGLDGIWDAVFEKPDAKRLVFRIQTGRHGSFAKCDSPDRGEFGWPAVSLTRDGQAVEIVMRTLTVRGQLDAAGERIAGEFLRGDQAVPIALVRRLPGAPAPQAPLPAVDVPAAVLAGYAGTYAISPGRAVILAVADGRLTLTFNEPPAVDLTPVSATEFARPELQLRLTVEAGPDGRGQAVTVVQGRRTRHAVREA